MKASTRNLAAGNANIAKGGTKQAAGRVLGKRRLEAKGIAQKTVGRIQKAVGKSQKRDGC
jgi:uncharacterized protein YjbJ (UPF0337 family)